jgi:hypothetical protein
MLLGSPSSLGELGAGGRVGSRTGITMDLEATKVSSDDSTDSDTSEGDGSEWLLPAMKPAAPPIVTRGSISPVSISPEFDAMRVDSDDPLQRLQEAVFEASGLGLTLSAAQQQALDAAVRRVENPHLSGRIFLPGGVVIDVDEDLQTADDPSVEELPAAAATTARNCDAAPQADSDRRSAASAAVQASFAAATAGTTRPCAPCANDATPAAAAAVADTASSPTDDHCHLPTLASAGVPNGPTELAAATATAAPRAPRATSSRTTTAEAAGSRPQDAPEAWSARLPRPPGLNSDRYYPTSVPGPTSARGGLAAKPAAAAAPWTSTVGRDALTRTARASPDLPTESWAPATKRRNYVTPVSAANAPRPSSDGAKGAAATTAPSSEDAPTARVPAPSPPTPAAAAATAALAKATEHPVAGIHCTQSQRASAVENGSGATPATHEATAPADSEAARATTRSSSARTPPRRGASTTTHTNTTTTDNHVAPSSPVEVRHPQTRSRTMTAARAWEESEGSPAAKRALHSRVPAFGEGPQPARGAPLSAEGARASSTAVPPVVDVAASAAPSGAAGKTARGSTKSSAPSAGAGADRS